jgi:hypothetical protein
MLAEFISPVGSRRHGIWVQIGMIFTISRNMCVYARALIEKKIDLTDLDPNEFTSIRGFPDAY